MRDLTGGLVEQAVPVTINKLLYLRHRARLGATVPHEVAASPAARVFLSRCRRAGVDAHDALARRALPASKTSSARSTPTRHLIEAAADLIPARIISLNTVVSRNDGEVNYALFTGDIKKRFRRAAGSAVRFTFVTPDASTNELSRCSIRITTSCGLEEKRVTNSAQSSRKVAS